MWTPWRRVTGVVVRASGLTYACRRDAGKGGGWRCGRCERGVFQAPEVGRHCAVCEAEVIAAQRGLDAWVIVLVVLVLVITWAAVNWWH